MWDEYLYGVEIRVNVCVSICVVESEMMMMMTKGREKVKLCAGS